MKLKEPQILALSQPPGEYHRALRCIGQDLTHLAPSDLQLINQEGAYIVNGHCSQKRLEAESAKTVIPEKQSIFDKLFTGKKEIAAPRPTESDMVEFSRSDSVEDIDRLDQAGIKRRTGMQRILDARSLAEILRTVGHLMDNGNYRLTLLNKQPHGVLLEYRDTEDQPHEEELKTKDLVNLHESYFKTRGTSKARDLWRGNDV